MLRTVVALAICLVGISGCNSRHVPPVQSLAGSGDVSSFVLRSLKGTRDGERLEVQALYGDLSQTLLVDLQFNVTPPARLVSGSWTGLDSHGAVRERSLTFLGGQAGPPGFGGTFDLLGPDERALYRIAIPMQELKIPFRTKAF